MNAALQKFREDPPRAICILLVLSLVVYAVINVGMLYAKLDFTTGDLGGSDETDFFVYYSSARFLEEVGMLTALYDPEALKVFQISIGSAPGGLHPFNYPPTYALLIQPLAALPYPVALICWQWGTMALFALSLRIAGLHWFAILAAVAAPASIMNFAGGQTGFLTSALFLAGATLAARKPLAAGALFGLLTIKPHLGLLIPFALLAKRQWRIILAATVVTAALTGLAIWAFDIVTWADYLDYLAWFTAKAAKEKIGDFLRYSISVTLAAQVLQLSGPIALTLQAAVTMPVCVCIYWAFRQRAEPDLQLALLFAGTGLAVPYGYVYDMPILAVAAILMALRGLRHGFRPYEGLFTLWAYLLPFVGPPMNQVGIPVAPLIHLVFFVFILTRLRSGLAAAPQVGERRVAEALRL